VPPNPPKARRSDARREPVVAGLSHPMDRDEPEPAGTAALAGERIRRVALGLTAALVTARAYTTSEPDMEYGAGAGLYWVLALLIVAGLAIAAGLVGGRFRFRWSWTDAAVVALMVLVASSSRHAMDRLPAINLAWEWLALGVAYLLLRNLPRTRDESTVLAGAMVATAFAVSVYGLYQVGVELPELQAQFRRNPVPMLAQQGIAPNTPSAARFADRLMGSIEPWSTFALANSLAGFIVGPLVLILAAWLRNLARREPAPSRSTALGMAAPVILILLVCLLLTKSRSAYIGLLAGVAIVAWRERREVPRRLLVGAAVAGCAIVAILVGAGLATGKLDRQVLTQSTLSMRYRWEYWQATWGVITGGATNGLSALKAAVFRWGVGPGNFRSAYLLHKLPVSSEEILDPHDLFLEVWATAGFWAFVALTAAVILGLRDLLGRPAGPKASVDLATSREDDDDDKPPRRTLWLIASAGAGWVLVLVLGMMNLFEKDMFSRWLILGASWMIAAWLIFPLWRRLPISGDALGAAFAAVVVNLLAAGGIGIPTVALGLWTTLALGLNLREDRPCGRLRESASRVPPFVLSTVWAATLGLFLGAVVPYWRAEAALAIAEDAMRHQPPDFDRAEAAYNLAIAKDKYYVRPWLRYADYVEYAWESRGARASDLRWRMIPELLEDAVTLPRNPNAWTLHLRRAEAIRRLLRRVGNELTPVDTVRLSGEIVKETRKATLLYPTNATLHARLAEASAGVSMIGDAIKEAEEALRLDRIMPHPDKKLPPAERERLEALLAGWKQKGTP
jgi:hypothetical protein